MRCPKCGGQGGVLLFTHVAPCDACFRPASAPRTWYELRDGKRLLYSRGLEDWEDCVTFRMPQATAPSLWFIRETATSRSTTHVMLGPHVVGESITIPVPRIVRA